jgi:hypothetical protein
MTTIPGYSLKWRTKVVRILDLTHSKALETIANCDVVVGKILPDVGWFGKFELEGMALGKPVIAYVHDVLYERLPHWKYPSSSS